MKYRSLFTTALVAVSMMLTAACGSEDNSVEPEKKHEFNAEKDTTFRHDDRPDWIAIEDPMPFYMQTVYLEESAFPVSNPTEKDLLAAFINDECRHVEAPYREEDGSVHAHSMVQIKYEEEGKELNVVLRYYSAQKQHIYTSDPFPFVEDEMLEFGKGGKNLKWHE